MLGALRLDLILELISATVSFLVGYFSLKAYKTVGNKNLLYLYFGFIILGLGMLFRVVSLTFLFGTFKASELSIPAVKTLINYMSLIYTLLKIISYCFFAFVAVEQIKESSFLPFVFSLAPVFIYHAQLELISFVLICFVAIQYLFNFLNKRSMDRLLVFLGFAFITISHVFFVFTPVRTSLFIFGHVSQFIGFICLLIMLFRVSGVEKGA